MRILSTSLLVLALAAPALAEEGPAPAPAPAPVPATPKTELGKKAPEIVMQDEQGRSFRLLDCPIVAKDVEGVVRAAAARFGAAPDAKLETAIADLDGVKDEDGDVDGARVKELVAACGEFYGLVASAERAAGFKTLADLVGWITKSADAPIVLVIWSPNCPAVKHTNDTMMAMAANAGVRLFAVASNHRDTNAHYAAFREAYDFTIRVFPDRDQRVTDLLGGKTTPHYFLFDNQGVLRYRGALNNDPMGYGEEADLKDFVSDAAAAIRNGQEVQLKESEPDG